MNPRLAVESDCSSGEVDRLVHRAGQVDASTRSAASIRSRRTRSTRPYWGAVCAVLASSVVPATAQLVAPPGYKERMQDLPYVFNGLPEGEWVNRPKPGMKLPTGVSHRTYFSRAMGHEVGYSIYLPPQYEKEP